MSFGQARKGLLHEAAEWPAHPIVLGVRARGLLSRPVFGETALPVIRKVDRALFTGR